MRTATAEHGTEFHDVPLSKEDIRATQTWSEEGGYIIKANVNVHLDDIIESCTYERFKDDIGEAVVGCSVLEEIDVKPVDVYGHTVVFEVSAWLPEDGFDSLG